MYGKFGKETKVESNWDWLAAKTNRIQARLKQEFSQIHKEIQENFERFYPGMVWEITPVPSAPWLFCVSADGNPKLFPRVVEVVRAAPTISGWRIQAFRPRGSLKVTLDMGGRTLGYDDIWCSVVPEDSGVCITLWIRGLNQQTDRFLGGGAADIVGQRCR